MNTCAQAGCRNTDVSLYKLALRQQWTLLCPACHASLTAIGMPLIPAERREQDVPVVDERRRSFRPAWLRNLRPKDLSERLIA